LESHLETHDVENLDENNVFIQLIFGLNAYIKADRLKVPKSLRCTLNLFSFIASKAKPKTLYRFIELAHSPISTWYPLAVPSEFNPSQSLLYDMRLSEEAEDYYLEMMERLEISSFQEDVPQSAFDNLQMQKFQTRLRDMADKQAAQSLYEEVRLFLITRSWTTSEELRLQSPNIHEELKHFYALIPEFPVKTLRECERCGLLVWRNGQWKGIKRLYCSDHAADSPYIHEIPKQRQLYRLTEGAHLRVFIPGRIELALFEFAEAMQTKYPDQLLSFERYPGIDTYDLRLVFEDGEVWAVDAKDQAFPKRLAPQIRPPYDEGDLAYNRSFFVLPDRRMQEEGYQPDLEREIKRLFGSLSKKLGIRSLSAFETQVEEKLKSLSKGSRSKSKHQKGK
jgi:hypothetical protein